MKRKTGLYQLHFGLLIFLVLHFIVSLIVGWQLTASLLFWLKIIAFLSGIVLFFISWKNRSKLKYYFGIYVFSPLIVGIGYLLDGLMGAILASFFFVFFHVPEIVVSNGNFQVETAYAGFLSACCHYNLTERKFLILEKHHNRFELEAMPNEILKLETPANRQAVLFFRDYENQTDTTEINWP